MLRSVRPVELRWLCLVSLLTIPSLHADSSKEALGVLQKNCMACHSSAAKLSGLSIASREDLLAGGSRGPAVVPGKPDESLLMKVIRREGKVAMPPSKPLSDAEIATIAGWVKDGVPWSDLPSAKAVAPDWWSLKPVVKPAVPAGFEGRNPIDAFIAVKLREKQLKPAAPASKSVLIRRATYDLTGLAPTAEEIEAFTQDTSPQAYERLIDRLLASPHYGEKWGRYWLDLVRYADTAGFELDSYVADAWRYRDYVINSFNNDVPYDRFVREQLAGDEFYPEDVNANVGTGYFCVGPNRDGFPDQADINRVEVLTDYSDTTGAVFMGLTVGCARCHDHKFDPISQKDYYKIRAVFAPVVKTRVAMNRLGSLFWDVSENTREIKLREVASEINAVESRCRTKIRAAKMAALPAEVRQALETADDQRTAEQKALAESNGISIDDDEVRSCMNGTETEELASVEKRLVSMFRGYSAKPFACGATDVGDFAPKTMMPARGSRPVQEVKPGFLSALGGGDIAERSFARPVTGPIPLFPTTGRRHAFAEWLTKPEHPLTARVMVNRVWQYHFGKGIVATPSDFGHRGTLPTHPELLDYLAATFVENGWSVKKLHRLMMLSDTYRQSAAVSAEAKATDAGNLYLSHFSRRRLLAEEVRDSVLESVGRLNLKRGGKPVVVPLSSEELEGIIGKPENAWIVTYDKSEYTRRSIYLMQKRTFRMPMMESFDVPEPMMTCPRRDNSTSPLQSLTLFNGSFINENAMAFAAKLEKAPDPLETAWRAILRRSPTGAERAQASAFMTKMQGLAGGKQQALAELVRGLLNTNEFLFVE